MKQFPDDDLNNVVNEAAAVVKRGGIILYPTDTVWGLGCDATNSEAVSKLYDFKGSREKKGMLVLVDSVDNLIRYTDGVPEVAWQIMEYSEKPVTLILPGACGVVPEIIPEEGTIGIRVPKHEFCSLLLRRLRRPLVSTSANFSGEPSPTGYGDIAQGIRDGADYTVPLEYENGATGKPSSIIALGRGGEVKIIRE